MEDDMVQAPFEPPFLKQYFSREMVQKYEPLLNWGQKVLEASGADDEAWENFQQCYEAYWNFTALSQWDGNQYDIVFYGVSGYTGYLMMEYLKRVALKKNPESFTFAFAGRTPAKVAEMRDREFAGTKWKDTPVLQAGFDDVLSIIDLVKSARVIINVAGPYMLTQGELLVDACCELGCHYLDISGEIPWTLRINDLHDRAKKANVCVVPSAASAGGYPDLGVYLAAKKLREDYNEEIRKAVCYCCGGGAGGGSSGGTLKTRSAMSTAGDDVRKQMANPFSLGGFVPDVDRNGFKNANVEFGTGIVRPKLRSEDLDANMSKVSEDKKLGVWRGPNTYSYFDTRVVRRTNAQLADHIGQPYGRQLNFMEYTLLPTETAMAMKTGSNKASAGGGVGEEKARLEAEGKYFKEGEGPPLETLTDAWTGFFVWVETENGHDLKCAFVGADAYFETSRIAVEMAMTLRFDHDKLPIKGGVLTAVAAGNTFLAQRLIKSGVKFKMGDWMDKSECSPPSMG
eukprot:gnl/TRDRNA2_/TRDRNA2_190573_c0_seq1.p1 gnl/TRDRNA2_/TRDRNA2_190573_c0~~gnl/TRDRNA2_/TRDRNA2_190573_c0_seq1.p1  ORF type:complete len:513 (-),score=117.16 gnl/TRDRNA2_/TRDRNA2_190573_c0_seq1:113-1651(-)